jgi:hypothetical protein
MTHIFKLQRPTLISTIVSFRRSIPKFERAVIVFNEITRRKVLSEVRLYLMNMDGVPENCYS